MEEHESPPASEHAEADESMPPREPTPVRQSFKRRHWGKLLLFAILAVPTVGFAGWTFGALNWNYSTGQRAGYVQKISRKGWVCKTWEGVLYLDIAKGFRSDSFTFSVRSDSIAQRLESLNGRKVTVHYEQHKGVPTNCFGETEYFVSRVQEIKE
ncbi:MAG: hypothetical protein ABJC26_10415 [Gemmatimonadaceae bacterium]